MTEKCPYCKVRMKKTLFSNNYMINWYKCSECGKEFKKGYKENIMFPNLIELNIIKSEVKK